MITGGHDVRFHPPKFDVMEHSHFPFSSSRNLYFTVVARETSVLEMVPKSTVDAPTTNTWLVYVQTRRDCRLGREETVDGGSRGTTTAGLAKGYWIPGKTNVVTIKPKGLYTLKSDGGPSCYSFHPTLPYWVRYPPSLFEVGEGSNSGTIRRRFVWYTLCTPTESSRTFTVGPYWRPWTRDRGWKGRTLGMTLR